MAMMGNFDIPIPSSAAALFGGIAVDGDEYVRCARCSFGGCDVRVQGCGCCLHAVRIVFMYISTRFYWIFFLVGPFFVVWCRVMFFLNFQVEMYQSNIVIADKMRQDVCAIITTATFAFAYDVFLS